MTPALTALAQNGDIRLRLGCKIIYRYTEHLGEGGGGGEYTQNHYHMQCYSRPMFAELIHLPSALMKGEKSKSSCECVKICESLAAVLF